MNKRVLFIAYDYPPILSPESVQIQRRVLSLAGDGAEVYVLASHENPIFETVDENIKQEHKNITVIRTKPPFFEKTLNVVFKIADITDRKFWWQFYAYNKALDILKEKSITTIYTHSTPLVDHLVGLKLKKNNPDLKWIAHFSDPWTLNPYIKYKTSLQYRLNKKLENEVLQAADVITVTSEKTKQLFEKHFDLKEKIIILPHVFDPACYKKEPSEKYTNLIIVHTGNIYGLRTIRFLLQALKESDVKNLEFRFYGKIKQSEAELVDKLGVGSIVKIYPQIPYLESLKVISEADALLVVDAPLDNSPFFPSKLADYIGAKKPVIALTPLNSATADILRFINNNRFIANSDDLEGIKSLLHTISKQNIKLQEYKNIDRFDMTCSSGLLSRVFFGER